MMHGAFCSHGAKEGLHHPCRELHHSSRHLCNHSLNPLPYYANCFDDKLHLDQNEKCAIFGMTHVLAIEGYSRKIVGFITIPKKNATIVYDLLFRPLLSQGLWEQVRTDHGTEFTLVATAQSHLSHLWRTQNRQPVFRSLSCNNRIAERIWPEINCRVNYPVKRTLIEMKNNEEIDMSDEIKFCVSWVSINVVSHAIHTFVEAWNSHRIPGLNGGIPNVLSIQQSSVVHLHPTSVPSTARVVQLHERGHNGRNNLCFDGTFGHDPLQVYSQLKEIRIFPAVS